MHSESFGFDEPTLVGNMCAAVSADPWLLAIFVVFLAWFFGTWVLVEVASPQPTVLQRYMAVGKAWWSLNVLHRNEAGRVANFLQGWGVPIDVVPASDAAVAWGCVSCALARFAPGLNRIRRGGFEPRRLLGI